jgi:hypothetical protein
MFPVYFLRLYKFMGASYSDRIKTIIDRGEALYDGNWDQIKDKKEKLYRRAILTIIDNETQEYSNYGPYLFALFGQLYGLSYRNAKKFIELPNNEPFIRRIRFFYNLITDYLLQESIELEKQNHVFEEKRNQNKRKMKQARDRWQKREKDRRRKQDEFEETLSKKIEIKERQRKRAEAIKRRYAEKMFCKQEADPNQEADEADPNQESDEANANEEADEANANEESEHNGNMTFDLYQNLYRTEYRRLMITFL